MSNLTYYVSPEKPVYVDIPHTDEKKNKSVRRLELLIVGAVCLTVSIIFLIIGWFYDVFVPGNRPNQEGFSVFVFVSSIAVFAWSVNYLAKKDNERRSARESVVRVNEYALQRVNREAVQTSEKLLKNLEDSKKLIAEITKSLKEADGWLTAASYEFRANAFAPYWDAVEQAVIWLAAYHEATRRLTQNAKQYYEELKKREHTFPSFPIRQQFIPDARQTTRRLNEIVRRGQTNFHFSNIWEHRQTRQVIVAEFSTLKDALYYIDRTIEDSVSDLRETVSSEIANLVELQIEYQARRRTTGRSIKVIKKQK